MNIESDMNFGVGCHLDELTGNSLPASILSMEGMMYGADNSLTALRLNVVVYWAIKTRVKWDWKGNLGDGDTQR